jgi:hypothetical protein
VLIEDWRVDYNHNRPHSSLGMMTPGAFAASVRQPLLGPTPTAAEEEVEGRAQLSSTMQRAIRSIIPIAKRKDPAEDITRLLRPTATAAAVVPPPQPPTSHNRWTDERAPVSGTGATKQPRRSQAAASARAGTKCQRLLTPRATGRLQIRQAGEPPARQGSVDLPY